VKPHVDGTQVVYAGEVGHEQKVALLGGARALLYPVQAGEPFGLVLAEAMACGTPVAALDRGAVREVVDDGLTGRIFGDLEAMVAGLPDVFALDRARVRRRAVERFGIERMATEYIAVYERVARHGVGEVADHA
jgi:glycosyltransferase involved in cell wall biosynthesis